ncbi:MAG: AAA family ATPase [Pseudomonadota bacterium]
MEYTRPVSLYNEYLDYFGFSEAPFSIAPNPDYLYMSDRHREALAHLLYGVNTDGGFVLISGEVGTGKTTLCRHLVGQLPESINVAFVLNPRVSAAELLATICDELNVEYPDGASIKQMIDPLNHFLLAVNEAGRKTVVIIDEAQNMDPDVLEQLRLLTNLETHQRKLLQVVLLGQPELLELLSQPSLRQLLQRVTARYHLDGLSSDELPEYVAHRLRLAGGRGQVFSPASLRRIYRLTGGIPRLVNLICDRALLGTYVQEKLSVDVTTVRHAAKEVLGIPDRSPWIVPFAAVATMIVLSLGAYAWSLSTQDSGPHTTPAQNVATAPGHTEVSDPTEVLEATRLPTIIQPTVSTSPFSSVEEEAVSGFSNPFFGDYRRERDAFAMLFDNYANTVNNSGNCDELQRFKCVSMVGTLDQVRRLNRPVVVRVDNAVNETRYLVITGLTDDVLLSDGRQVRADDLLQHWNGEFTLLWQPPQTYQRVIRPGDRHPALIDVRSRLQVGDDASSENISSYDDPLVQAVRRFQLTHGLKPDGLIGVQTLILLANESAVDFQRLDEAITAKSAGES